VKIPIGVLTVVTGVSGSGKSTLIYETLYRALMQRLHGSREAPGDHDRLTFDDEIDKVIVIDQSPIGRTRARTRRPTPRSLTISGRSLPGRREAKVRGYKPGRFSFNLKGGRCEACQG